MDLERIQEIRKNYGDDRLLEFKGAIGVDVDYKQVKGVKTDNLSITVYVKKKFAKEELTADETVPAEIEGIPTDVIECPNVWPTPETCVEVPGATPQVKTDPLVGGLSISNQNMLGGYGTLGIVLSLGGLPYALSCAHVMVSSLPGTGQAVIEPSGPHGGHYPQDSIGTVNSATYGPSNADIAFVQIQGRGTRLGYVLNIGQVSDTAFPAVGQDVRKMGVRTGLTAGRVGNTSLTWRYTTHLGTVTLYNQTRVDGEFALPGDSGSAVIGSVNNQLYMVGMVVSGTTSPPYFTVCNKTPPSAELTLLLQSK